MTVSPNTITFPEVFYRTIDEVLMSETYANRFNVSGAEFTGGRTVKVPEISFSITEPDDYDRFDTERGATLAWSSYTLDYDKQMQFYVDAAEDIDTAGIMTTQEVAQYDRTILAPYIDTRFFADARANAGGTATTALTVNNVKEEFRKMRSQFTAAGLSGGDVFVSSNALALLEDATDRQWSNEGTITDTIGNYNGFNLYEVPEGRLGNSVNFIGISGGQQTIRYIVKRATTFTFAPGQHTKGDGWLTQLRWIFGNVVWKNKKPGVFASIVSYVLTEDETFQEGTTYYTRTGSGTAKNPYVYTAATVTAGASVTANTYYVVG